MFFCKLHGHREATKSSIPFSAQFSLSCFNIVVEFCRCNACASIPHTAAGRRGGEMAGGERVGIERKVAARTAQFIFRLSRDSNQQLGRYR